MHLKRDHQTGKVKIKKEITTGNYIFQITLVDELAKKQTQVATQWIDFEVLAK